MSEPREVEVLPCGYRAACLVPWCRRRATKVLRYLDTGTALSSDGRVRGPRARAMPRDESDRPQALRRVPLRLEQKGSDPNGDDSEKDRNP